MKHTRTWYVRYVLITLFILTCAAPLSPVAWAQGYPNKRVRVIVQYSPGGMPDTYGRIMSAELSKLWNQSVVVENRTGGSGTIGTEAVAKATPDGYTLLFAADTTLTIVPTLMPKIPYDSLRDLQPIINVVRGGFVLMVHPSVPANNLKELIAWIRAQNGKASFASSGSGTPQHLAMELIRNMAGGLDMIHVPYKGFGQGLADVLAGQVSMIFGSATAAIQMAKGGKLKFIAATSKLGVKALPEVRSIAEDLPGFEILDSWYGFVGPAGLPREIVNKIHADVMTIVKRADFQERLIRDGLDSIANSPEEFAAQIKADLATWVRVLKTTGAKLE